MSLMTFSRMKTTNLSKLKEFWSGKVLILKHRPGTRVRHVWFCQAGRSLGIHTAEPGATQADSLPGCLSASSGLPSQEVAE